MTDLAYDDRWSWEIKPKYLPRRLAMHAPARMSHPSTDGPVRPDKSELKASDLWAIVRAPEEHLGARVECLAELAEREDPELPEFLVQQLDNKGLEPRWRDALLVLSERVLFPEPAQQVVLTANLFRHALELRDAAELHREALWAAIWRYGTLVPEGQVATLIEFLRPRDVSTTRQIALQSVANVFSRRPPGPSLHLDDLRLRVDELAGQYLTVEWVISPENGALAVSAFCAAAALASQQLDDHAAHLIGLGRGWMIHQVLQELVPIASAWRRAVDAGGAPSEPIVALEGAIASLERTRHSSTG